MFVLRYKDARLSQQPVPYSAFVPKTTMIHRKLYETKNIPFISYKFVKRFFGDTFFITSYFMLKLAWCVSTFFFI